MELEMGKFGAQALMATLDEVQPHCISFKLSGIPEHLIPRMLHLCLCGSEILDSAHIIHEAQLEDRTGKMQCIRALFNWIATSIIMAIGNGPSLCQKHPYVPDGCDGSDGNSYPLTENNTLKVAQATGCAL